MRQFDTRSLAAYRDTAPRHRVPAAWQRRVVVLGSGVEEIVRGVGGWACDRSMSGWEVLIPLDASADRLLVVDPALAATRGSTAGWDAPETLTPAGRGELQALSPTRAQSG